jgi:hypothetical protein
MRKEANHIAIPGAAADVLQVLANLTTQAKAVVVATGPTIDENPELAKGGPSARRFLDDLDAAQAGDGAARQRLIGRAGRVQAIKSQFGG